MYGTSFGTGSVSGSSTFLDSVVVEVPNLMARKWLSSVYRPICCSPGAVLSKLVLIASITFELDTSGRNRNAIVRTGRGSGLICSGASPACSCVSSGASDDWVWGTAFKPRKNWESSSRGTGQR